jgi:hypothetical protein
MGIFVEVEALVALGAGLLKNEEEEDETDMNCLRIEVAQKTGESRQKAVCVNTVYTNSQFKYRQRIRCY